jgi:hypothetical protein
MLGIVAAVLIAGAMAGCGGGSHPVSPLVGTQTVVLQANGGGGSLVSHQMTINFTVKQ